MTIKRSIAICFVCLFMLSACVPSAGERYTAWAQKAYEGTISWEINGKAYAGRLSLAAGKTVKERRLLLVYTAPASLAGICVQAVGEEVALSLNGSTHTLSEARRDELLPFLCFFDPVVAGGMQMSGTDTLSYTGGAGTYTATLAAGQPVALSFSSPTCRLHVRLEGAA
ncbi:MAG: hypothetical protein J6D31_08305 [Clostridia bacterium]|nr:hypothetical protein [Clostridia bacterium]